MRRYVITLDRTPARFDDFKKINDHVLGIQRFSGVDGSKLDRQELERNGVISNNLPYSMGMIGNALSHMKLWELCASCDEPITIIEDDAILSHMFDYELRKLDGFEGVWDIVAWGWILDVRVWIDLLPGISPISLVGTQGLVSKKCHDFQRTKYDRHLYRLIHCYGFTMSYSITPRAAKRLLSDCRPLRPMVIGMPQVGKGFANESIDAAMGASFPHLEAFICMPPLALSAHEASKSLTGGYVKPQTIGGSDEP